ncbi:Sulfate transport system permease protein CysW [Mariniblastus fucicola]|uniref:Sulfate transport system permease protein CysW n=2 Tax=Mariniblastus fucicola TaxID=980251 RepID=A0A5B9PJN5_9BACT|nr:Sulfate transport system permease protein CysW [Mariniblastus fucicola]
MSLLGGLYIALIVAMLLADFRFADWSDFRELLGDEKVRYSIWLSLISCTISAILSIWVAVPTGYVLARLGRDAIGRRFPHGSVLGRLAICARYCIDTLLDIPIVLPPLVVGISLLVLMQTPLGRIADDGATSLFSGIGFPGIRGITYEIPAVILAQFTVAAAFAIRTMRDTFEQINERPERVACTLGASRFRAFADVALPQAWRGTVAAFTLAWARSLGEFGPILIFAGTARMKTEVLSTTVYLNFQFGNLRGAVVASLILVTLAIIVLIATRFLTLGGGSQRGVIA